MAYSDYRKHQNPKQKGKVINWKLKNATEIAFDLSPLVPEHKECVRCKRMIVARELDFGRSMIWRRHDTKKHPFCKDSQDCKKHIKKEQNAKSNKKTKSSQKRK